MMDDSWARELALILLVKPALPGFMVTIVPGPLYAEFEAARPLVRPCSHGHFHVSSLGVLPDCSDEYMPAFAHPERSTSV